MGLSSMGTTAAEAGIQAPAALKTVVMSAADTDVYLLYNTPQGAPMWYESTTPIWFTAGLAAAGAGRGPTPSPSWTLEHL